MKITKDNLNTINIITDKKYLYIICKHCEYPNIVYYNKIDIICKFPEKVRCGRCSEHLTKNIE